jgi:hypothetical protein
MASTEVTTAFGRGLVLRQTRVEEQESSGHVLGRHYHYGRRTGEVNRKSVGLDTFDDQLQIPNVVPTGCRHRAVRVNVRRVDEKHHQAWAFI